jgi:Na+/melibiose symporter-like transporter
MEQSVNNITSLGTNRFISCNGYPQQKHVKEGKNFKKQIENLYNNKSCSATLIYIFLSWVFRAVANTGYVMYQTNR